MAEKTWLTGKDAALEDSIERMFGLLKKHGFDIEEVRWFNPVPHVWSVHIRDRTCPMLFSNGKGTSRKAALASALGEFFERLATNFFFADFYLGEAVAHSEFVHYPNERWFAIAGDEIPAGLLDERLHAHYNPQGELTAPQLIDINSGHAERGICALPFRRQRDGATVYIPVNIIGNLYVSNGMAAGNTLYEARTQGLSEVLERYVKNRVIAEGLCLPDVPAEVLKRYPKVMRAIEQLEAQGFPILVRDASLGGQFPVMSVTLLNPENGGVLVSFGAHPSQEVALERALTELLQGRDLDQLDVSQPPTLDMDTVADPHNLESHFIDSSGLIAWDFLGDKPDYAFCDWDFSGDTQSEFEWLVQLIHDQGFDIYIADYPQLGVYSCRILVPGMSEIYPVEELIENNNNAGVFLRKSLLHLDKLSEEQCAELLAQLDEKGFNDMQPVAELLGLAADAGSAWASLRIGELKAWLALAIDDQETALYWVKWTLHVGHLSAERTRLMRALQTLLEMTLSKYHQPDHFRRNLCRLVGENAVAEAEAILRGELKFAGLHSPGYRLEGLARHANLLETYQRLQRAKSLAK